jgi:hypothetical protein
VNKNPVTQRSTEKAQSFTEACIEVYQRIKEMQKALMISKTLDIGNSALAIRHSSLAYAEKNPITIEIIKASKSLSVFRLRNSRRGT